MAADKTLMESGLGKHSGAHHYVRNTLSETWKMHDKTIWRRLGIIVLLLVGGFVFPLLFVVAAWLGWTVYTDLKNPQQPDPNANAWFVRRWTVTAEDPEWKSNYLPFCESPAETAFLEAMITAYGLLPDKGVLRGAGLTLNLQVEKKPYRVDFLANDWLVIEIDGAAYHSSPEAVARDQERDRFLQESGYSVLRIPAKIVFATPDEAVRKVRSAVAAGRRLDSANAHVNANKPTLLQRVVHGSQQVAKALDEFDHYVTSAKETQNATRDLRKVVHEERSLIEAALRSSKSAVDLEKRLDADPSLRKHFNEAQREFDELERELMEELNGLKGGGAASPLPALPIFDPPPRHTDPKIADAVEREIASLKKERDLFLSSVVKEVGADGRLRKKFEERLRELGAHEIYKRVFPSQIW